MSAHLSVFAEHHLSPGQVKVFQWTPVKITFLKKTSTELPLSNPLLLAGAVDVVYGRSHGAFVVLFVRVCIRPLEWLGDGVVLHGSVAFASCIGMSASDQLYSSIHSFREQRCGLSQIRVYSSFHSLGVTILTLRKCASPERFHELIHLNKRTLKWSKRYKNCGLYSCFSAKNDWSLIVWLTVKQVGGGINFMRTTAAGGTGKTPPGTGCKPGAAGEEEEAVSFCQSMDNSGSRSTFTN